MSDDPITRTLDLVDKAKAGDDEALNRLFGRYYERVRRAVRARIGARLRQFLETDDILQQTFAKAFQKFGHFELRSEGSLVHWLATIAEGQVRDAVDVIDAKKRKPPGSLVSMDATDGDTKPTLNISANQESVTSSIAKAQEILMLEECLDLLSPHHREVIVLRDFEGLEWEEVAHLAGRPSASAARDMYTKATLELARLLRRRGVGKTT